MTPASKSPQAFQAQPAATSPASVAPAVRRAAVVATEATVTRSGLGLGLPPVARAAEAMHGPGNPTPSRAATSALSRTAQSATTGPSPITTVTDAVFRRSLGLGRPEDTPQAVAAAGPPAMGIHRQAIPATDSVPTALPNAHPTSPHAAVSRALPTSGPAVSRLESPAQAAIAGGLATRSADGSITFVQPPERTALVSREPDAGPAGPSPDTLPAASAAPPSSAQHAATATDPGASPPVGTTDIAAMTDLLYERIEYRLRTDLMHERERLGSLPDR